MSSVLFIESQKLSVRYQKYDLQGQKMSWLCEGMVFEKKTVKFYADFFNGKDCIALPKG